MSTAKLTQSQIDGVEYRRAKLWQIILFACNGFIGMSIYMLIGNASYAGSIGFGISTAAIGIILTGTRILDGFTDPLLAFIYDRVNTRFGKLRILMLAGFIIESLALLGMFVWLPGKGLGSFTFVLLYVIYVIGYTCINMTTQTIPPLLTNDPKQRPIIGVWQTVFNYMIPMALNILIYVVMLPMFGGTFTPEFLAAVCEVCLGIACFGMILVFIGITPYDKPENFVGLTVEKEKLSLKEMTVILKDNKPLQAYIVAAASDKLAQVTASQAVITTMLNGIIIGNMGLSTTLSMIGMLPSILFAIYGARYAGKLGSKKAFIDWSKYSIYASIVMMGFFIVIDPSSIATSGVVMVIYVILTLVLNGTKMVITTAQSALMSDIIDYELDRSDKFVPAVVSGVYSLIDKVISSFGAAIAAFAVAMIGYKSTMPQPGEPSTPQIFWVTMIIMYIIPIIGFIISIIAMNRCHLDKEEMIEVQKRIKAKKDALKDLN